MQNKTLWKLEAHTLGKHKVLRKYLDAWLPIMASRNERILFIDGFAGPGEYEEGEEGSPIIALQALAQHKAQRTKEAEVVFVFIEKNKDRAEHLEELVSKRKTDLPETTRVTVINGLFDRNLTELLDALDSSEMRLAPALVMIDPFGVSDTPMDVIHRILEQSKAEVYISFMYESINRFKETPEFEEHLDALFGSKDWANGIDLEDSEERKSFFYSLYERQLRSAGAKNVLHFELYEGNRLVYAIFFATKSDLGCDRMKQAIWGVAPWGDFKFKPVKGTQLALGLEGPDTQALHNEVLAFLAGKGWMKIEEIEKFMMCDETSFHSGHLKKRALAPLEKAGKIEVKEGTRQRKGSYPPGTILRSV